MINRQTGTGVAQRDDVEASEDMLFDFFDFFDRTVNDLYAYVLNRLNDETVAEETVIDLYFSLLQRRRFFWWRKVVQISTLLLLADKKIRSMDKGQKAMKKEVFDENTLEAFLGSFKPVELDAQKRAAMRMELLERYRAAQMSNIRFVPSVAVAVATTGCFLIISSTIMQPVSTQGTSRRIAAAQVLLLEQEREYRNVLVETQYKLKGITAHHAEKDLARITLDLAPYALQIQLNQEREVGNLLREMSKKALLSSIKKITVLAMK